MNTSPSYQNSDDIVAYAIQASLSIVTLIEQSFLENKKALETSQGQYVRYKKIPHETLRLSFHDLDWAKIYPRMEELPDNLLELVFPEVCRYFMDGTLSPLSKHQLFERALHDKTPQDFMGKLPIYWGTTKLSLKDFHKKIDTGLVSIERPAEKSTMLLPSTTQAGFFLRRLMIETDQVISGYFKHHVLKTQGEEFPLVVNDFIGEIVLTAQKMEAMIERGLPLALGGGLLNDPKPTTGLKIK